MNNGLSLSKALNLQSAAQLLLLPASQLSCQCSERSSSLCKSRRKAVSASGIQLGLWVVVEDAELASWGQQGGEQESKLDYSPG